MLLQRLEASFRLEASRLEESERVGVEGEIKRDDDEQVKLAA